MNIRRPTVRSETDYSYIDKSSGRPLSFTPKPDEMMVTFQETPSEATLNDVIRTTPLLSVSQGYDLDYGFATVYVSPDRGMEAAMRSVDDRSEIANSLPVMIDQEGITRYFLPDEFTVQFLEGISKEQAEHIISRLGSRILVEQRTPGYYTLAVPEGRGLFETIREFSNLEEVAFAEPSEVGFNWLQQYIPDDPDFPQLWGLNNTGQTVNGVAGTAGADIDAPEAWTLTRGDPNIIIAVIDTGADLTHPDLAANILPRGAEDWNFANPTSSIPQDISRLSHGTHVSGTIAAVDNAQGVIGVAPNCLVMPLCVTRGPFDIFVPQAVVDAINYVSQQAAANPDRGYIINGSWGGGGDNTAMREAIQNADNNNVVAVFAAGNVRRGGVNTDINPVYPAVYPEVISVAALDQNNQKPTFSNFGTNVDVSAPGVSIRSTTLGGRYGFSSGTSMAAPHVCGVAALVWSVNRNRTNQQVRQVIENTCDEIEAANPGFVGMLGRGRINASRAVSLARGSIAATGSLIAAAARMPEQLDVWAVGNDGQVWSSWWSRPPNQWNAWSALPDQPPDGFPVSAPVAVAARMPEQLDVFAVGNDGRVWSSWWNRAANDGQWNVWFPFPNQPPDGFPAGAPVAAVARLPGQLDVFAVGNDGRVWSSWWSRPPNQWSAWFTLPNQPPDDFPAGAPVAVATRLPEQLDVFAVSNDGQVWTSWWSRPPNQWNAWFTLPNQPPDGFPAGG